MTRYKKTGGNDKDSLHIETRLTHLGREPEQQFGFVNPPLYRGSTVLYPDMQTLQTRGQPYSYGRRGSPTYRALEDAVSELEDGAHTVLTSSGLSACALAILALASTGGHVLITDSVYQPVRKICSGVLKRFGIETTYYDPHIGTGIAELIRENTQIVYVEAPGSQTLEMQDIPAIATAAHAKSVPVIADNTWASPLYCNPLKLGADMVVHAGTKYFGGHSDVNLGTVTTTAEYADRLRQTHGDLGQCAGPEDAQYCLKGLRTLAVRIEHHRRAGLEIAEWLSQRPEVARIIHPARADHPGHDIWKRDFTGSGGLFSFVLKPCSDKALAAMVDGYQLFGLGASWGGYESLAIPFNPVAYRTATRWEEDGPAVRLFIGLEHTDDLKADLEAGFARLSAAS